MIEELNGRAEAILATLEFRPEPGERSADEAAFYEFLSREVGPAVASIYSAYEKRRVILDLNRDAELKPSSSYIGGHPFVASDESFSWPLNSDTGRPMTFLMQVNFAELPKLDGFPESGLLQWWIKGDDDSYGLSFERDATGQEGILLKFYSEAALSDTASSPLDSIPNIPNSLDGDEHELGPLWGSEPLGLRGTETLSFPGYEESTIGDEAFFSDVREVLEDSESASEEVLDLLFSAKTQLGGYPSFVQGDPRYRGGRPEALILQLDSIFGGDGEDDVLMWGDAGNAQIFGDLAALSRGDLSSFWWDWACY